MPNVALPIEEPDARCGPGRPDRFGPGLPDYDSGSGYDELIGSGGRPRSIAEELVADLGRAGLEGLGRRQTAADQEIRRIGVTFPVAGDDGGIDRPWPFDVIPRLVHVDEWRRIEEGLVQRLRALNLFIDDVYHDQRSSGPASCPARW